MVSSILKWINVIKSFELVANNLKWKRIKNKIGWENRTKKLAQWKPRRCTKFLESGIK